MDENQLTKKQKEERKAIQKENELLRNQIKTLRNMENRIQHNATLIIVGKGAQKFENELLELNNYCWKMCG